MANLQVGRKTIELLKDADYSQWDDEELIRGQQKDKTGRFRGRLPKVIPLALLQELHKRNASHGIHKLEQLLLPAIDYLGQVAKGEVDPDPDRIRVCDTLINRILGKTQDRVVITADSESEYAKAGVREAIVVRRMIDVDSKEEDDPFDE
jgi:hypothetical protein